MKLGRTDLAALAASLIWGINFSSVKFVLLYVPPFAMGVARFFLAALLLLFLLRRFEGTIRVSHLHLPRMLLAGCIGFGLQQICFLYGLRYVDASIGSLLSTFTTALMVVVTSVLARERLTPLLLTGLLLACAGMVCVLLGKPQGGMSPTVSTVGCVLVVGAGLLGGVVPLINKGTLAHYSSLRVSTWTIMAGWIFFVPIESISQDKVPWMQLSALAWLALLFSALGATAVAQILWNYGLSRVGVVRMTLYGYVPPVLGVVFATVLLNETLSPIQWSGAVLTLCGVCVSQYAKRRGGVALSGPPAGDCVVVQ